jgi:hypothetical protein
VYYDFTLDALTLWPSWLYNCAIFL